MRQVSVVLGLFAVGIVGLRAGPAFAWVFHEHQVITERAIQDLPRSQLQEFDALWQELRELAPARLCPQPDRTEFAGNNRPQCLSFSAFPAIAGDHSCSPENMWENIVNTRWIMDVARIAHRTRLRLDKRTGRDRLNVWNYSHLLFERADSQYASRSAANFSHFVPYRTTPDFEEYLQRALLSNAPINAVAIYALNHWAALRFALDASALPAGDAQRQELVRLALTAEAYALHYLEDSVSSGHVVGVWGGSAQAKGTHDHYCIVGIDAVTWDGYSYSAYGDAHMTDPDLKQGSLAVRLSLQQLLDAFRGDETLAHKLAAFDLEHAQQGRAINTCQATWVDLRMPAKEVFEVIHPVWAKTLKPSPGPEEAHLPRFKAEIGSFFGVHFNTRFGGAFLGYDDPGSGRPLIDIAGFLALGFGVEGATGLSSDGTFMLGVGLHGQGPQFDLGDPAVPTGGIGDDVARVPGRLGLAFLVRLPFYLIPGDLVVLLPLLAPVSMSAVKHLAINAADGGLIPWQRIFVTRAGDFQFVLGRETQITLFGLRSSDSFVRYVPNAPENPYRIIRFSSIELDFPIFQWRFFRAFSDRLTSTLMLTVGGGIDIPFGEKYLADGVAASLDPAGFFYLRFSFDGRIYFRGPLDR